MISNFFLFTLVLLILVLWADISAVAQCKPVQTAKLLADDGEAGYEFGKFVAIDGITAIVAVSPYSSPGSAYLFDTMTGNQIAKLLPHPSEYNPYFAEFSVGISGSIAIVGAPSDRDNGGSSRTGSAYLFDSTTGQQIAEIYADDGIGGDRFGHSVAISETTAIVGTYRSYPGDLSGSVYLFDATTFQQMFKLLPDDGTVAGDYFGFSVAISGTTAIVGSFGDLENGFDSGSAYLFDTATGNQIAKLLAEDGDLEDWFGRSVAIDGNIAIVGAYANDDNGNRSGSAYVFDATTGQQIFKLLPDDGLAEDWFGYSVAISGTTAVISAHGVNDNGDRSGVAYVFDAATGNQLSKFTANDNAEGDDFGRSVAINGTTAICGARFDDDNGANSGSAYLFDIGNCDLILGDASDDGVFNNLDIASFVLALTNQKAYQAKYPELDPDVVLDMNGDGVFDNLDIADFVAALVDP